jgi:hypothetical protein
MFHAGTDYHGVEHQIICIYEHRSSRELRRESPIELSPLEGFAS